MFRDLKTCLFTQAKRRKREAAANAKILEAEKRSKASNEVYEESVCLI